MKYNALITKEIENNQFSREIQTVDTSNLPQNGTLVQVKYSSLNYKDALSARGHKGITRNYPFQPGIDAAGIIAETNSEKFKIGDEVLVTGYDLGMNTPGGFGEYINVPEEWIVTLPEGLSLEESMYYGTAGLTAAICVDEIINRNVGKEKPVLVTGATGGVGITAVGMLKNAGYNVVASTGKSEAKEMLIDIGANEIINRDDVIDNSGRPLNSAKWASVVDTVGGNTLSSVIKSTDMHGVVCVLGNVAGDKFDATVYPFLLRGVSLLGIDSASKYMDLRLKLWQKIATDWKIQNLEKYIKEIGLEELSDEIDLILLGKQKGRIVINFDK